MPGIKKPSRKTSLRTKIRRANRRRKASSFEKEIHSILKEEKIAFMPEKTVGRCHADLFIKPNILVELNGCYWHGHSCQGELSKTQKTALAKDSRRYYFFEKLGFKLEIIWECDLKKSPEIVRKRFRALAKEA